jgi:hypothetical protein
MYAPVAGAAGTTGAKTPGSNAAVAGRGDGNGFETSTLGGDLASIDNAGLTSRNTGSGNATDGCGTFPQNEDDYHYFTSFGLSVPAGSTVNGITVTVTASSTVTGSNLICVGLSPDGGTSTTSAQSTGDVAESPVTTYTVGGASDTWGRTWSSTEFSDANFRVYLMPDPNNSNARTYFVDQVTVDVAYTTAGGSYRESIAIDRSGHGNNGTLTNGPQRTIGKLGQALSFDGVNDYVDAGSATSLRITGSLTIATWVKSDATSLNDRRLVSRWNGGEKSYSLKGSIDNGPNQFQVVVSSDGTAEAIRYTNSTIAANTWYHVVAVYNATLQTLNIYLNGALDNGTLSGTVPASLFDPNQNLYIGNLAGAGGQDYWKGQMDDVRIYNRALSPAEIKRLYKIGNPN